jgi:hypothetical protein
MSAKFGKDTILEKSLTVQGGTTLENGLTVTGEVDVTGGITSSSPMNAPSFHQTSDYRAKSHIIPIEDGLDVILKLEPSTFYMKFGFGKKLFAGLIAHEVQEVIDHPVMGDKDGERLQRLDYIQLIPYLIRSIQQQQEQITELREKLKCYQQTELR